MLFPLIRDRNTRRRGRTSVRRPVLSRHPSIEQMEARKLLTWVMINSVSVVEGTGGTKTADLTVSLTAPSTQTITVDYKTSNGTATSGADYGAQYGTLTFAPGQKTIGVSVPIGTDSVLEPNENFKVGLSLPTNATIISGTGVCTIKDDDAVVTPELMINDPRMVEGNSGTKQMVFTVSLTAPVPSKSVTVTVRTTDGSAIAGSDYVARTEVLTFAPGETTKQFSVTILGDAAVEGSEAFYALMSNANVGIKKPNLNNSSSLRSVNCAMALLLVGSGLVDAPSPQQQGHRYDRL